MILIPVKNLENAKQRLSPILDRRSRQVLAQAMVQDVLETLAKWGNHPQVAVVTNDPFARELAHRFAFQVLADTVNCGETEAIEQATATCEEIGAESTLVLPGDIPLFESWELEKILVTAPAEGSVLVPARNGRGTNAAWRRPPGLFPLRFGNDSFRPHLNRARASGKPCVVLSLPGIALDVDTPEDLFELAAAPGNTRAQRLVRQWNPMNCPLVVNE